MFKRFGLILACVLGLQGPAISAEDPKAINWDDLVPPITTKIENPFDKLDPAVLDRLGFVYRSREDVRMGLLKEDSDDFKRAMEVERELMDSGVDVKGLFLAAENMEKEAKRRGSEMNKDLDGKVIRMPGYALPLEQSKDGVTEFLLVPYVGACIHTPPPPANQIVYVKLSKAYKVTSLYEPVWITGRIAIEASSRTLSFVDGAAPVATGYRMDGVLIEPYKTN